MMTKKNSLSFTEDDSTKVSISKVAQWLMDTPIELGDVTLAMIDLNKNKTVPERYLTAQFINKFKNAFRDDKRRTTKS